MSINGRRHKYAGVIPEISHKELVKRAFACLKFSIGCSVAFKERVAPGSASENPGAIGFKNSFSYLIECKSTRSGFLADKKKLSRKIPSQGMGIERYFMSPVGLLQPGEIPKGWGLPGVYEVPPGPRNRTVKKTKESECFYDRNMNAEVAYLVSAIRRLDIS